jgi:hypothetical protein
LQQQQVLELRCASHHNIPEHRGQYVVQDMEGACFVASLALQLLRCGTLLGLVVSVLSHMLLLLSENVACLWQLHSGSDSTLFTCTLFPSPQNVYHPCMSPALSHALVIAVACMCRCTLLQAAGCSAALYIRCASGTPRCVVVTPQGGGHTITQWLCPGGGHAWDHCGESHAVSTRGWCADIYPLLPPVTALCKACTAPVFGRTQLLASRDTHKYMPHISYCCCLPCPACRLVEVVTTMAVCW